MRTRTLVLVGLFASLLLAGGLSHYSSSQPDGLEQVAEQAGFGDTAEEHAAADGPLADYRLRGVENERLSVGLAGATGAVAVLLLAGGLGLVLRRRGTAGAAEPAGEQRPAPPADRG